MADGVTFQSATPATPAAGVEIATDDAGADGHVQIIKLAISTDGSATVIPADATNGLDVDVTRLPALVAGSAEIGKVRVTDGTDTLAVNSDGSINVSGSVTASSAVKSRIQVSSAGLTTASTAYSANDQLGTILEFTSAVATSGGYGTIIGATLLDKAKVVGAVSLYLFDRSVTLSSDNGAADFSDSDMLNYLGVIEFPPPVSVSANAATQVEPLALPIKCNATSLFGALVTRTGHTFFGAVGDLVVTLILETS